MSVNFKKIKMKEWGYDVPESEYPAYLHSAGWQKTVDLACKETWSIDVKLVTPNLVNLLHFADNRIRVPSSVKDLPKSHNCQLQSQALEANCLYFRAVLFPL